MRHTQRIVLAMLLAPASLMAGFSIDGASVNEGDSGVPRLVFTVTLDACLASFCSVTVFTDDDTALAGDDYLALPMPIATPYSAVPQQWEFRVSVLSDTTVELTERMIAILMNPVGATINGAGAYGYIVNDDSAQIRIWSPPQELEDTAGTMSFRIELLGEVDVGVDVRFQTIDQTATAADGDYIPRSGWMMFFPPPFLQEDVFIPVQVTGDSKVELSERFLLYLSEIRAGGRDVTFLDSSAPGTILNDDSATLSVRDVSAIEGDAGSSIFTFDVSLDREVDVGVAVDFATADGTAMVVDNDYEATFGTLFFGGSAGEVESINVTINGDTEFEPDETFFVDLSNVLASGRNVTLADDQGQGTILSEELIIFSDGFE